MDENTLTEQELGERIAILTRLRKLLIVQREKFREYLDVLEKQETSFCSESIPETDMLLAHTELEQQIVGSIKNLQKVIQPIDAMYHDTDTTEIPELKADLSKLQNQVLLQNSKNRELLKSHINNIRSQIVNFNNPYKGKRSVYAVTNQTAHRISVEC
jgi:hypothetical protein